LYSGGGTPAAISKNASAWGLNSRFSTGAAPR
jgi:hypothetical protein